MLTVFRYIRNTNCSMQGTMPGAHRRGIPRIAWMDNIKTWKSQSEWQRTEINGESTSIVWPTLVSRTAKQQNSTEKNRSMFVVNGHVLCPSYRCAACSNTQGDARVQWLVIQTLLAYVLTSSVVRLTTLYHSPNNRNSPCWHAVVHFSYTMWTNLQFWFLAMHSASIRYSGFFCIIIQPNMNALASYLSLNSFKKFWCS